jgi:hypothetical protein
MTIKETEVIKSPAWGTEFGRGDSTLKNYLKVGFVYFVQAGTTGPIKIGFTKNEPALRIRQLQDTSPHKLRWIGFVHGKMRDELMLHAHFDEHRIRAEWFRPAEEIKDYIEENCPDFCADEAIADLIRAEAKEEILAELKYKRRQGVEYAQLDRCLAEAEIDSEHLWGWIYRDRLPSKTLILKTKQALKRYREAA